MRTMKLNLCSRCCPFGAAALCLPARSEQGPASRPGSPWGGLLGLPWPSSGRAGGQAGGRSTDRARESKERKVKQRDRDSAGSSAQVVPFFLSSLPSTSSLPLCLSSATAWASCSPLPCWAITSASREHSLRQRPQQRSRLPLPHQLSCPAFALHQLDRCTLPLAVALLPPLPSPSQRSLYRRTSMPCPPQWPSGQSTCQRLSEPESKRSSSLALVG